MTAADTEGHAATGTRLADCVQLTRPRLTLVALLTVAAGAGLPGTLLLGIGFLRPWLARARGVPRASLVYLPAPLAHWLLDAVPHG
jgi:hypothetical protein